MRAIEGGVLLVLLVTVLSGLARAARLPPPVVLAFGGLVVGLLPHVPDVQVDPSLVAVLVLPLLLYAAALELPAREVLREWRVVSMLAVVVVLASTALVAVIAYVAVPGLTRDTALVLGALLAATDAVAVTALARHLSLPRRLSVVVQSESLFNDATSLVAFKVALGTVAAGQALRPGLDLAEFFGVAAGGVVIGFIAGGLAVLLRRYVHDPLTENAISLLTPFAAFLPAEAGHVSGLTAVVVCGLYVSPRTATALTSQGRLSTQAVWSVVVYLLEGVVFALIGLQLPTLMRALHDRSVAAVVGQAAVVFAGVVVVRLALLFLGEGWLAASPRGWGGRRPRWREPLMLGWVGTRGVVALAAALSIPLTAHGGRPFPGRELLLVVTTVVILDSLVVQGLTLAPLARLLGLHADARAHQHEEALARHQLARVGLARLEDLLDHTEVPDAVIERLRRGLEGRVDRTRSGLLASEARNERPAEPPGATYPQLRRELLVAERTELVRLRDEGQIGEVVLRRVQRSLDIEEAGLL